MPIPIAPMICISIFPSIRRIRRATTTQRCQTLAPSEFNLDDINSFNGKITDFNYKFLGEKKDPGKPESGASAV